MFSAHCDCITNNQRCRANFFEIFFTFTLIFHQNIKTSVFYLFIYLFALLDAAISNSYQFTRLTNVISCPKSHINFQKILVVLFFVTLRIFMHFHIQYHRVRRKIIQGTFFFFKFETQCALVFISTKVLHERPFNVLIIVLNYVSTILDHSHSVPKQITLNGNIIFFWTAMESFTFPLKTECYIF